MERLIYIIFSVATATIGYRIHNSIFWAVIDFLFAPLVWLKWLILHEVNLTIIKEAFSFFLS
jgi:hypothetical protein